MPKQNSVFHRFSGDQKTSVDSVGIQTATNSAHFKIMTTDSASVNRTAAEYIEMCTQIIKEKFSGEYIDLNGFIKSIEVLKQYDPSHSATLKSFILSRLNGKSMSYVPNEPESVDAIIDALQNAVKPISSEIICVKMGQLKCTYGHELTFKEKLDELSDSYERSMIFEGYSRNNAKEKTMDEVKRICQNNSNSNLVHSVISASQFEDPKDVTKKFVLVTIKYNNEV